MLLSSMKDNPSQGSSMSPMRQNEGSYKSTEHSKTGKEIELEGQNSQSSKARGLDIDPAES